MTDIREETELHLIHLLILSRLMFYLLHTVLLAFPSQDMPAGKKQQRHKNKRITQPCPPRKPERRMHHNRQAGDICTFISVTVCGLHIQCICSGSKTGKSHTVYPCGKDEPSVSQPLQIILVGCLVRQIEVV